MQNLYSEYAQIESQLKILENQKDELRGKILEQMIDRGEDKIETSVGKFTVAKIKSWTYPDKVVKLGEDFKAAKAKAESTGDATYEEKESLRFTMLKI